MADYDVIVIGGGVNGLTSAAYLAKSGLKTLVLEGRGECGTHCDTNEPGIPGFLHNLHATWLVTAVSPAMGDLELDKYGLELRGTDYVYGKTFKDGKNALLGTFPIDTINNWEKHSSKDAQSVVKMAEFFMTESAHLTNMMHDFLFTAPSEKIMNNVGSVMNGFFKKLNIDTTFDQFYNNMDGFQATDVMFESPHIKTMIQSLAWISALPPIHKQVGSLGSGLLSPTIGPMLSVHNAKGGSHALPHSLVKCATHYGVKILPCCPVKKIIVENGEAKGVVLADEAIWPNETITAKKIISNLTLVPTFINLIGEDIIGSEMANRINKFNYDEQNLFGVYFALDGFPKFSSAEFDEGIQQAFMGYFGGETPQEMKRFNEDLVNCIIHDEIIANWFIPTLADPTQAPEGCHTAFVWTDVPPCPKSWRKGKLDGIKSWDKIKDELADQVTDTFELYAPGFKKLIKDRIIYTPLDIERNNPSAVHGNWCGGAVIPEQWYLNRPVKGIMKGGSRTFIKNLYLSNSIHPMGASLLASGYIAADEVAEDMKVREQDWWNDKACMWYLNNLGKIPRNLGVR